MATGYDVSALSAWTNEMGAPFVLTSLLQNDSAKYFSFLENVKTTTKIPTLKPDYDIFQSGDDSCAFNGKGGVVFDQRTFSPEKIKVEQEYCVKELEANFLAQELPKGSIYDELEPNQALLLDQVAQGIGKAMEITSILGVKGGASPVASLNLVDGMLETLKDAATATEIPAAQNLGTVAIDIDNVVSTSELMRSKLPADVFSHAEDSSKAPKLFMSKQMRYLFWQGYRKAYGPVIYNNEFDKLYLDGTRIEIVGLSGLTFNDSQAMWIGKVQDQWMGVDEIDEHLDLEVGMDQYKKKIWLRTEFKMCFAISNPQDFVIVNIT